MPAAVCPNGHAMDEGLFNCPACGVYRPSANAPRSWRITRDGIVVATANTFRLGKQEYRTLMRQDVFANWTLEDPEGRVVMATAR
jgi:hypothetical protein